MNKPTNTVRIESWTVPTAKSAAFPDGRKVVTKIAVRVSKGKPGAGQFHGATNFKGSVIGS